MVTATVPVLAIGQRAFTLLATLLALVGLAEPAYAQSISATIDRNEIAANEFVTLRVRIEGGYGGQPSAPEGDDFRVVRQSMSTSRQVTPQGSRTTTELILALQPTRTGDLVVGPVTVRTRGGVERTQPFRVRVTDAQRTVMNGGQARAPGAPVRPTRTAAPRVAQGMTPPPPPGSNELFMGPYPEVGRNEAFLVTQSTHDSAVVGEQVVIDYLLFQPRMVFGMQFSDPSEPEFGAVWFSNITDLRTRGRGRLGEVTVGNQRYDVALVHSYTIVPLEAGPLEVPSFSLDAAVRSARGSTPTVSIASQPLILEVRDPPSDAPAGFHAGNVGAFTFDATIDRDEVRVGDAVSLTMTVRGSGLMQRVELPDLPELANVRWFEPADEHDADVGRDGWLRGTATRRVSFVPQVEGEVRIPALTFSWYDPWTDAYDTATTEPFVVMVAGTNERAVTLEEVDESTEWTENLPAARPLSATPPPAPRRAGGPLYAALAAGPPVALMAWWALLAWRERREATAPKRREAAAGADARAALAEVGDAAADAATIASALREYLHRRTGAATAGAGHARLVVIAQEALTEELAEALRDLVARAERARYGGDADVAALRDEAATWIDRAEAHR